jgi:hypothetical protein
MCIFLHLVSLTGFFIFLAMFAGANIFLAVLAGNGHGANSGLTDVDTIGALATSECTSVTGRYT